MKMLIFWLSIVSVLCADDQNFIIPGDVLKNDGVLLICDGSSYYAFKSDGSFRSFPHGISGRCFDGTWKSKKTDDNPVKLEVTAKLGWENGVQSEDDYRRIVFFIYAGRKRPVDKPGFGASRYKEVFNCH